MTYTDISLDIESAGCTAGYAVVNVGAVLFDRFTGDLGPEIDLSVDVDDLKAHHYKFDLRTMAWWETQPDGVREHCWAGILPVTEMLAHLSEFITLAPNANLWVKGEHMDIAMLEFMYDKHGLPVPWHFRSPRDLRTYSQALEDAYLPIDFDLPKNDKAHTGLGDAISQAQWVIEAARELRGVRP